VAVYDGIEERGNGWEGMRTIVEVRRYVKKGTKKRKEIAYYISSLGPKTKAETFNKGIRSHWHIENSLHYIKDKTFEEDGCKVIMGNGAKNLSIVRNIIINIFRKNGFTNMAQAIRIVSNDVKKMWELVSA